MKNITLLLVSLLVINTAFADHFTINNQVSGPFNDHKSTIAIQWAASAKEVEMNNKIVREGLKLNPDNLFVLTQLGKNNLAIPEQAEYFRVLVWSKSSGNPDFLTNWVDLIPNKTYTLTQDLLVPVALMSGTGC
ncbi:hypothetical protein [Legionella quateirensis]|uniref:Uncharacterized protein n=1 Tax=Legionella quateirensis TaxID=45072 RepID=A0A378KPX4_9GAMM|nr:hypothetical protein [Legionella quateirensis]KTD52874.1 hypothetical protein Lqua_0707 [Legionella quateirensis]STY16396.1 Uncharacterised protein [Legionella quateirensis]